jgi:hypothetical protein
MTKRLTHIAAIFNAATEAIEYAESIRHSPNHDVQDVSEAVQLAQNLSRMAARLEQKEAHRVAFLADPSA